MHESVNLEDYQDTAIEKSFMSKAGTTGKVPIRKTVQDKRTGKTFQRTYWVKPKDMKAFKTTEKAAEFLTQTVEAQEHFAKMMRQVGGYNTQLAGEVYQTMQDTKGKVTELANSMVKTADWSGARQTSISDFMAAAKLMVEEKGKDAFSFSDLEKLYADVSYKYNNSGLAVVAGGKVVKLKVASAMVPENWAEKVGGVAAAVKKNIAASLEKVKDILGMRKKAAEPPPKMKPLLKIDKKEVQVTKTPPANFENVLSQSTTPEFKTEFLKLKTIQNIVGTKSSKALTKVNKLIKQWVGEKAEGVEIVGVKKIKPTPTATTTTYVTGHITIDNKKHPFVAATNKKQKFAGISGSKKVIDYITITGGK